MPLSAKLLEKVQKENNLNDRTLMFCANMATRGGGYGNKAQSYIDAGYKVNGKDKSVQASASACKLLRKDNVKRAITSLLREHHKDAADKFNLTRDKILEDLEFLKIEACNNRSYMPAVRATELQGRAIGIGFERKVVHRHELISTSQLIHELGAQLSDDDELEKLQFLLDKSHAIDADEL